MASARALSNETAIVAVGTKVVERDDPLITSLQIQLYACQDAMRTAGIDRTQIGALFTGRPPMGYTALQWNMRLINELKIVPRFSSEVTIHGAGVLGTLHYAALAVQTGTVDYAICCSGCTGQRWTDLKVISNSLDSDLQFEAPYGTFTPVLNALWAQRYMHEFEVTPEDMALVAVENRRWALEHPHAAMRDKGPLTVDDVVNSRPIALPLRLLDCSAWYRGGFGTALVVTRSELVRPEDRPVYLSGIGQCVTHEWVTERLELTGIEPSVEPNLLTTGAKVAADAAYEGAGWGPADVDLVETSSPFTYANMMMLEDFGFCEKGEGAQFVRDGGIDFEDGLPFNTNGGYLSFGQAANGMHTAVEAIQQLRGEAEGKPVASAERALVHFHGGAQSAHTVALLCNEEGLL
ncbi:MAG: thiolase family protein [Solirubrobacteraceae bacterium]